MSAGRALSILALAALLVGVPPVGGGSASAAGRTRVVRCRGGGCWPAAFAFTPDGATIFYAERYSGEIRRVRTGGGKDRRFARIPDVAGEGEQGVLGLALDPDWAEGAQQQWVYVFYTEEHPLRNRIVRLRRKGGGGVKRDRLASLPAQSFHDSGVLHVGPDEKLYAVTGEAGVPSRSQDIGSLAGKVLRLEQNGSRPDDNPIAGSKAFSFGHRNSFGFAFDPQTGALWQSENGPECDDEVNLVLAGENYGWGGASDCPNTSESGPSPQQPKITFNPVIAPTGVAFCEGCGLAAEVEGDLLMGSYVDDKVRNLTLTASRDDITESSILLNNRRAVLALEAAPDGRVYFSDPRGIYRLT